MTRRPRALAPSEVAALLTRARLIAERFDAVADGEPWTPPITPEELLDAADVFEQLADPSRQRHAAAEASHD